MSDERKPYDDGDGQGAYEGEGRRAYGRDGADGHEATGRNGRNGRTDRSKGNRGDRGNGRGVGGGGPRDRLRRTDPTRLPEELRALGRSLDAQGGADGAETMVERVLGQILAEQLPVPVAEPPGPAERLRAVRRWTRVRWRSLTAALCGLLAVLVLTPPVRAAVFDWFDFAGVEVRYDPSAVPSPGAEVPGCGRSMSLAQAERRAGFEPLVPQELGMPDTVAVTGESRGRFVVSLCWREDGRTIRLEERRASLDLGFAKTVREPPQWISLRTASSDGGTTDPALWFPRPHLLTFWLVDARGERYAREERTAGPTLLWAHEAHEAHEADETEGETVTLRLEGVASKERAVEIARSLGRPTEVPAK
ncbi:hypothetical protein [Streptomyces viridochromogenes]|uniref:hypothetical protein n=1 Tax=Streptomyces viridochromogenes TaxID=1938 RepID=UPI000A7D3633|nr:hypothetical protein [Streptomyces viridochromogenes]